MMQKFVVGRYYFNSLFKPQADKSFVEDLQKEPYVEASNYSYAIGNFHSETESGHELISGTFGRVRKGTLGEVYDKNKQEFSSEVMPDVADVTLRFIINHKTHLIFVEYDSRITPEYFAREFSKIYVHNSPYGELVIDFIFEEHDVYEAIEKLNRIDKVVFTKLRPSNPSSMDSFEDIENLLKETGSNKTKIEFQAPPKSTSENGSSPHDAGLNYDSTLIRQALALSAHGYGEATITGEQDGHIKEVKTQRFLKKVEVDFYEDGALKKITQTIEDVAKEKEE